MLHIDEVTPGRGVVDHARWLQRLDDAQPDAWVLLEHLTLDQPRPPSRPLMPPCPALVCPGTRRRDVARRPGRGHHRRRVGHRRRHRETLRGARRASCHRRRGRRQGRSLGARAHRAGSVRRLRARRRHRRGRLPAPDSDGNQQLRAAGRPHHLRRNPAGRLRRTRRAGSRRIRARPGRERARHLPLHEACRGGQGDRGGTILLVASGPA